MHRPRSILLPLLAAAVLLTALSPRALADGKVFARYAAIPQIPDQEALIHYAGGVQTLVISTRFTSVPPPDPDNPELAATESGAAPAPTPPYAWVVPVPSHPEVLPVTRGLFPTLRTIFAPTIIDRGPDPVVSSALAVLSLILLLGACVRARTTRFILSALALLAALLLAAALLPTLAKARSSETAVSAAEPVTLLERKAVGAYDVAVIAAADPASADAGEAISAWLTDHGFAIPAGVEPVLADYAARNWCFVAARLHAPDPAAPRVAPHPLAMRFQTAHAVYPLKLTGVGNGPLKLDLYVFADQMARADGFEVARCAPVEESEPLRQFSRARRSDGAIHVSHEALRSLAPAATVASRLTATLTPEQMTSDALLRWSPPRWTGAAWYTPNSIARRAGLAAAVALLAAVLALTLTTAIRRRRSADFAPPRASWTIAALAAPFLVAAATYAAYTRIPAGTEYARQAPVWLLHQNLCTGLRAECAALEKRSGPDALTLDALRQMHDRLLEPYRAGDRGERLKSLAQRTREEDSPGNFILREAPDAPGTFEYLWMDESGRTWREWIWSPR